MAIAGEPARNVAWAYRSTIVRRALLSRGVENEGGVEIISAAAGRVGERESELDGDRTTYFRSSISVDHHLVPVQC
jgi:hypothetical protein